MPNFKDVQNEVNAVGSGLDVVRRKYMKKLFRCTKRNTIIYYSGWLQKPVHDYFPYMVISDNDKNGFMAAIHKMDKTKGLDLLLHTPGGDIAATESLVVYLRKMFGCNIRAIIPQIAMSAGTMIALSCREIVLGKHSNLGPIDPQINDKPALGVVDEFEKARREIICAKTESERVAAIALWQPIIAKYSPTLIGECLKAITWSQAMVEEWLKTGMFSGDADADAKARRIVSSLGSHEETKTHSRHIDIRQLTDLGVKVSCLEDDQRFQECVLSVHHACISTLMHTQAVKIIENHDGAAFITMMQMSLGNIVLPQPPAAQKTPSN